MTQPSDSEDSQWLDALAGNPSAAADPKVNQQALAVRAALQARRQRLDQGVPEADYAQHEEILLRLQREGLRHIPKERPAFRWKFFVSSVASAFLFGILVARFALFPASLSTRGISDVDWSTPAKPTGSSTLISLKAANPEQISAEIIMSVLISDLQINARNDGGTIQLLITGFRPLSKTQSNTRRLLGVSEEISGDIAVIITKVN